MSSTTRQKIALLKQKEQQWDQLPKELLDKSVVQAWIREKENIVYLIEKFENGEYTINGRPYDENFKAKNLPDYGIYIRFNGDISEARPITNHAGTITGYETKFGTIEHDSFHTKLNGKEMAVFLAPYGDYYDWVMQSEEEYKKNGRSKGEYNEAIRLAKILYLREIN